MIKFRAWWVEQKVMCDVDVIGFSEGTITVSNENTTYQHLGLNEVELMQSTGLEDVNGVEIYEGDIVSYVDDVYPAYSFIGEVKRQTYQFCIQGQYDIHGFDDYYDMTFEILGNIYENPERL